MSENKLRVSLGQRRKMKSEYPNEDPDLEVDQRRTGRSCRLNAKWAYAIHMVLSVFSSVGTR
jgi:hypothetical protein